MLSVLIVTGTQKFQVIADTDITPFDLLAQNGVNTENATISIGGHPLAYNEGNKTFGELGCSGNIVLSAIVKADSAC